jgi:hypothetical protein
MKTIELGLRDARKGLEAINDNRYLSKKLKQEFSNTFSVREEFREQEDDIIDELKYQLESWGISEFEIN